MRWARRLGVGVLVLAGLFVAATLLTARRGDPAIWPPRADDAIRVVLVSNGYHTGIALPREKLAELASEHGYAALIAVTQRFASFAWLEIGWGDEGFYRLVPTINDLTLPLALRALFAPGNPSVLHVVGVPGDPVDIFPSATLVSIPVSAAGFDRLAARIEATFVPPRAGALPDAGKGLYGPSLFYPAVGHFSILRVCNHWVADLLDAAGLPTAPVADTLSNGLLLDLRWRAGLRPEPHAVAPSR